MATLNSCKEELRSIVRELIEIEEGVRHDFSGIGQNNCADCLQVIVSKYQYVLTKLNNVDTNLIADFINGDN